MPPPCTRRTDSSKHRVRQYTDKLLSIQGAKYRSASEDNRCKQSSPVKSVNETNLAPIPEERYSMIENENFQFDQHQLPPAETSSAKFEFPAAFSSKISDSQSDTNSIKSKNEQLRQEFFKDLYSSNKNDNNYNNTGPKDQDSLKRKKQLISAAFTNSSHCQQQQSAVDSGHQSSADSSPKQLTPVNPLLARSRSASPLTFTSCVKIQYKPKMAIPPPRELYGRNQFELSRSQSASNVLNYPRPLDNNNKHKKLSNNYLNNDNNCSSDNNYNNGVYHAEPFYPDELPPEIPPPPRPPLPKDYLHEMQHHPHQEENQNYFLSLPRDWNVLARSASYSALLR